MSTQYPLSKTLILKKDLTSERLELYLSSAGESIGDISVDCEMMGLKPARDRLCLVQLCDAQKNVTLIQIEPEQVEAPNLKALLEHEKLTKIFHFGRADMAFLEFQLGIYVNPFYCTKIASKLARTYSDKHGLREIAREFLGIDLNKGQQSSDWGKDSLTNEQIEYAANDVLHLIDLKRILNIMLIREGRMDLAERCFAQVELMVHLDLMEYEYVFEHQNPNQQR